MGEWVVLNAIIKSDSGNHWDANHTILVYAVGVASVGVAVVCSPLVLAEKAK